MEKEGKGRKNGGSRKSTNRISEWLKERRQKESTVLDQVSIVQKRGGRGKGQRSWPLRSTNDGGKDRGGE